jgi:pimeloyl-ACP methyl ester carboxylesterase
MAVEDTENARRLFVDSFGQPEETYLHGQSWGGNVAAKAAETYGDVEGGYDGVLLTNGFLAGGSRGYDHRVDLRVVYQYYCRNLPLPSEEQYPLWQGLPAESTLTPEDVGARLEECTGLSKEPADRTPRQRSDLEDILAVTGLSARSLDTHLMYATFLFQDIVWNRLDGRNPFSNEGVEYLGSKDDAALNAGVARFAADPTARRDLSYDSDLTGDVDLPVLTLHAIGDPSVSVEHQAAYRATLEAAGREDNLVQTFTTEEAHNELSEAEYAASLAALDEWASSGTRPSPESIAEECEDADRDYGGGCFYDWGFRPPPLHTRIAPRPGGTGWPVMSADQERAWSLIDGVGIAP